MLWFYLSTSHSNGIEKRFLPGAGRGDLTQKNLIEALASRSNQASLDLNGMQYKKAAQLRLAPAVFAVRGVISI